MNADAWPRLIESLHDPDVYDHAVAEIEVLQTHISWVVLTGPYAYKIKKPVDLGFVDFTTLDKRRFFCHEEMRLNRRLAPELYLDVVSITGDPDAPRLSGPGEPFEYAVKMLQFPQDALLTNQLEQGLVLPTHIEGLARQIAEFHAEIDVAGADCPFGTPERIWLPVQGNFQVLLDGEISESLKDRVEALRDWSEREYAARHADFVSRKQDGCIRECHGDMHLGNMILSDGAVTIFDCIEFNDDFRWIDVFSDLAFCVMDLQDRGRPDLGHRLLNTYLEVAGGYGGLVVLPFFLAYRALVRAKVARLRLGQSDLSRDEQQHEREEFGRYLELAERYSQSDSRWLMITHGFSGSGKTRGTEPLVDQFGAVRVRSDIERKRLSGLQPPEPSESPVDAGLYSANMTERTYARLLELAAAVVRAGFPVVVDATFLKKEHRVKFQHLAEELAVPFMIVDFWAGEETLRRRILQRIETERDASEATADVLSRQLEFQEPLESDELKSVLAFNSEDSQAQAQLAAAIDDFLSTARKR